MNIREIAKKAGVSVATISRAINQETRSKIAPKTLKMVDELILKYGYTPNLSARNLNKSSTKTIGILFPYFYSIFHHSYYINILAGVADSLINTDYQFKILLSKEGVQKWDRYDFKKGDHIDGLLITHWSMFFSDKTSLENMNIPCVALNDPLKDMKANFVCGDQEEGGRKAAEHLYGLGHRQFAVLTGSRGSIDGELRLKGFCKFLKKKGVVLEDPYLIQADYREDLAYERTERLLRSQIKKPTAIFCLNDRMAFGVLRKLKELKIDCPKSVSVIGFDNDPHGKESDPPLTSVNVPLYELAQEAARLILQCLKSTRTNKASALISLFPTELIFRSSVAPVNR